MKPLLSHHNQNSIGLIGHTIINYPSPQLCEAAIASMVEAGVDLIELQIPFSEPVADGPLFMAANHEAIAAGVTVEHCFELMRKVTAKYSIPFVFMTYANILYKKGYDNFIKQAVAAGAKGAIVPDLPLENAKEYLQFCKKNNFCAIQVIPPNISLQRLPKIAKASQGFIYAVARSGVTGAHTEFGEQLASFVEQIRKYSSLPVAVGFGVTSTNDILFLKSIADYAIVGSQGLRVLKQEGITAYKKFWQELKNAARSAKS